VSEITIRYIHSLLRHLGLHVSFMQRTAPGQSSRKFANMKTWTQICKTEF